MPHLYQEDLYHFQSPVVVVLPRQWSDYSSEEHTLLQKILNSVRTDINSVQIVVRTSLQLDSLGTFSPARVLIFGVPADEEIPPYEETTARGFTVIRADDLSALDDHKKKSLWVALRRMFGI